MSAPLNVKLGLKPATKWCVYNPPRGFIESLEPLPVGCEVVSTLDTDADCRIVFALTSEELMERFLLAFRGLKIKDALWVAWPKKASNIPTDLHFEAVQTLGLSRRLVDNKVCAINETWTAMRFVVPINVCSGWIPAE